MFFSCSNLSDITHHMVEVSHKNKMIKSSYEISKQQKLRSNCKHKEQRAEYLAPQVTDSNQQQKAIAHQSNCMGTVEFSDYYVD